MPDQLSSDIDSQLALALVGLVGVEGARVLAGLDLTNLRADPTRTSRTYAPTKIQAALGAEGVQVSRRTASELDGLLIQMQDLRRQRAQAKHVPWITTAERRLKEVREEVYKVASQWLPNRASRRSIVVLFGTPSLEIEDSTYIYHWKAGGYTHDAHSATYRVTVRPTWRHDVRDRGLETLSGRPTPKKSSATAPEQRMMCIDAKPVDPSLLLGENQEAYLVRCIARGAGISARIVDGYGVDGRFFSTLRAARLAGALETTKQPRREDRDYSREQANEALENVLDGNPWESVQVPERALSGAVERRIAAAGSDAEAIEDALALRHSGSRWIRTGVLLGLRRRQWAYDSETQDTMLSLLQFRSLSLIPYLSRGRRRPEAAATAVTDTMGSRDPTSQSLTVYEWPDSTRVDLVFNPGRQSREFILTTQSLPILTMRPASSGLSLSQARMGLSDDENRKISEFVFEMGVKTELGTFELFPDAEHSGSFVNPAPEEIEIYRLLGSDLPLALPFDNFFAWVKKREAM